METKKFYIAPSIEVITLKNVCICTGSEKLQYNSTKTLTGEEAGFEKAVKERGDFEVEDNFGDLW